MTPGRRHHRPAAERSSRSYIHRLGRPMLAVLVGGIVLPAWAYQATTVRAATLGTEPAPVACTLCVLSPTGTGMQLSGNGSVLVHWGSVVVNSSSRGAVQLSGNAEIQSSESEVVGGVQLSGNPVTAPSFDQVPAPGDLDPYAAMTAPIPASTAPSFLASGKQKVTLAPGTYSSFAVSGQAVVTLQPGTYVITQSFAVSGQAQVSGAGVTLFFAGQSGMALSGGSTLHLTSPTTGTYAGISVFFDRADTGSISSTGNGSPSQRFLGGAVYAAAGVLGGSGTQELETTTRWPWGPSA